ncbi:MAG: LysM peptidoglycan-binding domain-containing protein [Alistipes senegalensis]|nr:LysM peptidoglycan-binding domain-containing protein [Bacteroides cellulosilyticus]MCM1352205.1 LysM peptidoglycan-binding domain-containing protein [Alistipes senegalensis]
MKRFLATILFVSFVLCAAAVEKSPTIVYINGAKYYVHTVRTGDTLFALAQTYGVSEQTILANNPVLADGLNAAVNIKIPCITERRSEEMPSERKLRKTFDRHIVAKGETFYSISRRYEIPVGTLMTDNPGVDPADLHPGETLLIRKDRIGTEDAAGSQAEWEEYRDRLNSVSGDTVTYHIVQKGDTFFSLSRRFGITEEQLGAMNDGLQAADLKLGAMLRIRTERPENKSIVGMESTDSSVILPTREVPQIVLWALQAKQPLQVALLLPVEVQNETNPNYLDFYRGFLLGLDSVRICYGHSVDVTLYNTERDAARVREILEMPDFARTQLIIGPVYEEAGLQEVVEYAERREIPVVSPLAHIAATRSDILFQMAPDPLCKYEKAADLFGEEKRITLIYANSTDTEFEQEMLALLGDRPCYRFDYEYVHETAREENSSSDLTPLLDNDEDNVLIVMADTEVNVDRILAGIASADTNLTARGHTSHRFTVLGNARWNRYNNIDRTMFFKDNVTFVSTYHAKRDAQAVRDFDSAYVQAFGVLPTLYSYRGYDAAMVFCPAMYNDIEYDMAGRRYAPLQTSYRFEQADPNANHTNCTWMRVDYKPDFTITLR